MHVSLRHSVPTPQGLQVNTKRQSGAYTCWEPMWHGTIPARLRRVVAGAAAARDELGDNRVPPRTGHQKVDSVARLPLPQLEIDLAPAGAGAACWTPHARRDGTDLAGRKRVQGVGPRRTTPARALVPQDRGAQVECVPRFADGPPAVQIDLEHARLDQRAVLHFGVRTFEPDERRAKHCRRARELVPVR
eukprot:2402026-Rhodomonas_salina.1